MTIVDKCSQMKVLSPAIEALLRFEGVSFYDFVLFGGSAKLAAAPDDEALGFLLLLAEFGVSIFLSFYEEAVVLLDSSFVSSSVAGLLDFLAPENAGILGIFTSFALLRNCIN